jgi:signal transduction histidine kinase
VDALRGALASHQILISLLHGQTFFVLGLSILLLTRRAIRLELARELAPLAAFGFFESASAWSTAWLASMSAPVPWLTWFRLLTLTAGYAILLAFGLQVFMPQDKRDRQRWAVGAGILLLWCLALLVVRSASASGMDVKLTGEILARYGLALPGGLLGAWGFRHEAHRTIEPQRWPMVHWPMRLTSLSLGAFALCGGLTAPAAPFFPANLINEALFVAATGVPVELIRALCGAAIAFGVVRSLSGVLDEIQMWLESAEEMQALVDERERIGRELHDGIIQSIYASGLILESARQNVGRNPGQARQQLTSAIDNLNEAIQDIRRYIFDLRGDMTQDDLETGLRNMLKDFRVNTLLETEFSVSGSDTRRFDAERRQHIFQIAREALTNSARHARARKVAIDLIYGAQAMQLSISDDGIGLSNVPSGDGHGLRNIRERTQLLSGTLDIDTAPDEGLTLIVTVPYHQRLVSARQTDPHTEAQLL